MPKAIVVHETGGPEVLKWEDIDLPAPGRGEIRLQMNATAVNFQDINIRLGRWGFTSPKFPYIPGSEGVGVVTAIGPEVKENFSIGQRVGFAASGGKQSYAAEMNVKAFAAFPIPDAIDDHTAAAVMMKGQCAHMLVAQVYKLRAGEPILVHGATGAIGSLLCQWAKHIGAKVIGTVGSKEKVDFALAHGCDHVLVLSEDNLSEAGEGIDQRPRRRGRLRFDRTGGGRGVFGVSRDARHDGHLRPDLPDRRSPAIQPFSCGRHSFTPARCFTISFSIARNFWRPPKRFSMSSPPAMLRRTSGRHIRNRRPRRLIATRRARLTLGQTILVRD